MKLKIIFSVLGKLLLIVGASMLLPMLISLCYREAEWISFLASALITMSTGLLLSLLFRTKEEIRQREGFPIVALGWLLASLFGTLPYLLSGTFPGFCDAFFETASGFTTTGASVMTNVETVAKGVLFWRSLTQWLGGLGIVVLFVALLTIMGSEAMQIYRAEVPGPMPEKISPRIHDTARILWMTYVGLTVLLFVLLWLLGMDSFDAVNHTFATMSSGGFSTKNAGMAAFNNPLIHWTIIVFMFLSGTNFALYYQMIRGKTLRVFWKNDEFIFYSLIIVIAAFLITANIYLTRQDYSTTEILFQVVSIVTTTGYATIDYEMWPVFSQMIIIGLMFVGGCAGSTSGSMKAGRHLSLIKYTVFELKRLAHPRAVVSIKLNLKPVSQRTVIDIYQFFFLYISLAGLSILVLGALGNIDLVTAFSAVISTMGNIGPGMAAVGPADNYAHFAGEAKIFLSVLMLLGRLEIYPIMVLLLPTTWRK